MTVTVVLQKQTSGYYTGRMKGNGIELGVNMLRGDRKARTVEEAQSHCTAAVTAEMQRARITPKVVFEIAPPAEPKPRQQAEQ